MTVFYRGKKDMKPDSDLFKWGPIDGRICYGAYWVEAWPKSAEYHKIDFPELFYYFFDEKMVAVLDDYELKEVGKEFFNKYMVDKETCKQVYDTWWNTVNTLEELHKQITSEKLESLPAKQLAHLYENWYKLHLQFWIHGYVPEFSNWGGERILMNYLGDHHIENFTYLFERLSAPVKLSFYQEEEIDLLQLKAIKNKDKLKQKLIDHQKKYFWIQNSYFEAKITPVEYFADILGKISEKEAQEKINSIKKFIEDTKKEKEDIIKNHGLSDEVVNMANQLSYSIWWQDFRKKYIFILHHYKDLINKEAAKRYKVDLEDLYCYSPFEFNDLLAKKRFIQKELMKERKRAFLFHYEKRELHFVRGQEAERMLKPYLHPKVDKSIKEIKGLVVSRGPVVRGRVKILLSAKQADKMKKGDVLVASMTSPEYIVALRKATALVTDEGGMTCHAAIVSRELGMPCIVGTKIATKALKDNDLVEVDANTGVVRIV